MVAALKDESDFLFRGDGGDWRFYSVKKWLEVSAEEETDRQSVQ